MSQKDNNKSLANGYAYCLQIAKNHYENFPIALFLMPREKQKYIAAIYAFARMADDIADEFNQSNANERKSKLEEVEKQLLDCYQGKTHSLLFIALADTIKACQIPQELFLQLLQAFKMDLTITRYDNFTDLLNYCQHSANPMGRLFLKVFDIQDEQTYLYSDKICTALQLTNFWQDIGIDLNKDRIYIPHQELKKFDLTEQDIENKVYNPAFCDLLKHLTTMTHDFFSEGKPILSINNKALRIYLKLTWFGGSKILDMIKDNDYDVYNKRPTLSRQDKFKLLMKSLF